MLAAQNEPLTNFTCSLIGTYLAFARTKDSADGRLPSLAERYADRNDYVNRIRVAARAAQAQGFLLPEDAAVIVNAAAAVTIFDQKAPDGPPR